MPFVVTIFPQRDFVSVEWDNTKKPLTFDLTRGGVAIGHAQSDQVTPPLLTDAENILEVNHPGGLCWSGSTPDVMPGDRLQVTESGTLNGVAATTLNVTAEPAQEVGTDVVVHGTARNADGSPMDLSMVEQRIINPGFLQVGLPKRDLRATSDGGSAGLLTADPAVSGGWIATYEGLTAEQRAAAVDPNAAETRGMAWQAVNAAGDRLGITIYEAGVPGGPGMPECPALASYSVAASTPSSVNAANVGGGLTLTGAAQDASSVSVNLDDGDPATAPLTGTATPTPATGAQSWSMTFPGAAVAGLTDGTLTARSSFTIAGGDIAGSVLTVRKDVVAPDLPVSDTPAGQYDVPQTVHLTLPQGEAASSVVRWTTDGTDPTSTSSSAPAVSISSSKTLRAAVFDVAGNRSAVAVLPYFIEPTITAPSRPDLSAAQDTGRSSTDNVTRTQNVTLRGTGTPGADVQLMRAAGVIGTGVVSAAGTWSVPVALVEGSNVITAESFGAHQPEHRAGLPLSVRLDTVAPTITSRRPVPGATGVARGANVVVGFSEPVVPSSFTSTSVVLRKATGGAAIGRSLGWNSATRQLTVNPGGASATRLAALTTYRMTLGPRIVDPAGNAAATSAWTFRTGR
ncbi:MAG: hypothetical protein HOQ22_01665 [Nocardioidaceae bacterium]|nr:hypothetical protein [Nocardioidaceae bacterium]NUS49733.1 hypothetical protein [Nocardioidaceae bacterium]